MFGWSLRRLKRAGRWSRGSEGRRGRRPHGPVNVRTIGGGDARAEADEIKEGSCVAKPGFRCEGYIFTRSLRGKRRGGRKRWTGSFIRSWRSSDRKSCFFFILIVRLQLSMKVVFFDWLLINLFADIDAYEIRFSNFISSWLVQCISINILERSSRSIDLSLLLFYFYLFYFFNYFSPTNLPCFFGFWMPANSCILNEHQHHLCLPSFCFPTFEILPLANCLERFIDSAFSNQVKTTSSDFFCTSTPFSFVCLLSTVYPSNVIVPKLSLDLVWWPEDESQSFDV